MFYRAHGIRAEVLTGPGSNWITRAKEDADVVYEETEYQAFPIHDASFLDSLTKARGRASMPSLQESW